MLLFCQCVECEGWLGVPQVGSLADLQQDATIAEISHRMEQGPLSNHTLLPNISETIAGCGARDISRETIPSPFEVYAQFYMLCPFDLASQQQLQMIVLVHSTAVIVLVQTAC